MHSIYLANHYCIDDEIFQDLIKLTRKMGFSDIFLLKQPFALHRKSSRFINISGLLEGYKLKYKFASAFDNTFSTTQFEKKKIIIYRNINIDVILFTQRLLMDQNRPINIQDIDFADRNLLHFLKNKSYSIKTDFPVNEDITDFDHFFRLFKETEKPGQVLIAIWTAYFWFYHPKEYWASKGYLFSCNSNSIKNIAHEILNLLETNNNFNEYFYPGMRVVWTPK